ncbi:ABC-2 family transporter protein [Deinococcus sp. YIM 77859]|uniref:ABC transporter permease n=1 Tax=Deinococcus sp. YIM 77859 TaxID=1540221 RepID=UPI0005510C90|nr:ABC-2 family transporter protein [Deinococcus sp. YIM 77859]
MTDRGVYWGFARLRFADLIATRTRFFIGIGSYFIYVSVYAARARAIYQGKDQVGGLTPLEGLTYVAVAWVLRSLYTNPLDREVTEEVRRGDIALSLLRPVDYPWSRLASAAGEALVRAVIFTLPAAVLIALVYPLRPPAGPLAAAGFLAGTVLAFVVYSQLNLLVGLCAVFTEHTVGLQRAKNAMVDLLGGVLIPLTFFPEWAQAVLAWLPFQAVTYTPVAMYLGEMNVTRGLLVQTVWAALLFVLVRVLWRRALGQLTVQGG